MLAVKNPHPRDARIQFYDQRITDPRTGREKRLHRYVIDGETYEKCSVTTLLDEFFPSRFDPVARSKGNAELQQQWRQNAIEAAEFGTMHHAHFEKYIDSGRDEGSFVYDPRWPNYHRYTDLPAWTNFQAWLDTWPPYWEPYRVEWFIFSREARLPGCIDIVLRDMRYMDRLALVVVDYKIVREPEKMWCDCPDSSLWRNPNPMAHRAECTAVGGHAETREFLNTKLTKACVQVAVYSCILEDLYGAHVESASVVYLHPDWPSTHKVDLDQFTELACTMINSRLCF